ncbi:uncharacterized protein LOC143465439 [Clavelina lepadiformis]|uniref:uncharacterized protein LOC143465439 n=1 Tax=Clavelina lepadiformis TaxID=159417 RepID=UPI0040411C42
MANVGNDEVICPICLEMLKKPIRMLSCGHNLCQVCLESLVANSVYFYNARCPACRTHIGVSLNSKGVESIPRNRTVENLMEKMALNKKVSVPGISSMSDVQLTTQELIHMESVALNDKSHRRFDDAIYMLQRIICSVKSYHRVKYMIYLLECLQETNALDMAEAVCKDLSNLLETNHLTLEAKEVCGDCVNDLYNLSKSFIAKNYKISIHIASHLFKFVSTFYNGRENLSRLEDISHCLKIISKEMSRKNKADEFCEQLPFIEELIDEMVKQSNCEVKEKVLTLASVLLNLSVCCNETEIFVRAIEFSSQGIGNMKTFFGKSANLYDVLGSLYYNLGVAYRGINQLHEANRYFLLAENNKKSAINRTRSLRLLQAPSSNQNVSSARISSPPRPLPRRYNNFTTSLSSISDSTPGLSYRSSLLRNYLPRPPSSHVPT